jgi:uncharacterized protein YhaN
VRFRELQLDRFGHFTDARLDLGGPAGLHIVCGANEAGKTTLLRAISDLLFGIEARSPYAFRHDYAELRLGAELEARDGRRLRFWRRKGRQNTVLDETGAPMPDGALAPFLGAGADRELFQGLFGLDHERLRRGGEDVLAARGALGEMLFEAGAGIVGLGDVLDGLERRANDLFSARRVGSKPFYAALDRFKAARRRQHEFQVGSDEWRRLDASVAEARARLDAQRAELLDIEARRSRAERRRRVLPLLTALAAVERDLEGLAGAPALPEEAVAEFHAAAARRDRAREGRRRCADAAARLRADLSALDLPEAILAEGARIDALSERRGGVRDQRADLPRRDAELRQIREQIADILRRMGSAVPPERARDALPPQPLLAEVRALVVEDGRIREREAASEDQLHKAEAEARRLAGLLDALGPARDPGPLGAALVEARAAGPVERRLAEAEAEADRLARRTARALEGLGLDPGGADALARARLPDEATVHRFEAGWAEAEAAAARIAERRAAEEEDLARVELEIAALERAGEVPDAAAVERARARRDAGWALLRARVEGRPEDAAALAAFARGLPPAEAYERAVRDADALADRKEAEAARVARHGELTARRAHHRRRIEAADAAAAERGAAAARLRAEWGSLWASAGVEARTPREMLSWLARRAEVVRDHEASEAAAAEAVRLRAERDRLASLLGRALAGLGEGGPEGAGERAGEGEGFGPLLRRAEDAAERARAAAEERRSLGRRAAEHRGGLEAARRQVEIAANQRGSWRARWTTAMAALGLGAESSPAGAEALLAGFEELDRRLGQATDLAQSVARMEENVAAFGAEVAGLCRAVAPDLAAGDAAGDAPEDAAEDAARDPVEAASALVRRLDEARQAASRHADLKRRLREAEAELAALAEEDGAAEAVLDRLRRAAGAGDDAALAAAVERSARLRDLARRRGEIEREMLSSGDGLDLAALRAEADGADPDGLAAELAALRARQAELQQEAMELGGGLAELERDRAELERGRGADRAAQEAQDALAELRAVAEEYLRLRAAGTLLRRGVERYRQEQQGPLLRRAAALFSALTRGAFSGLRVDYGERDQPVLRGERRGGDALGVEGMSEGTRDQLFLALRLAAVERYVEEAEPLPFVADDLLVNFDDGRAAAAFEVLGELAGKVQVLFFTHHPHLCEVARSCLGGARVEVHALPS